MAIKNFGDWKDAVHKEVSKLADVRDYLNEKGQVRLKAFGLLSQLAVFCNSAKELADWIESKEDLELEEIDLLSSSEILLPVVKLNRIAKTETETV